MLMNIAGGGSVKLQEKTVEPSSQSINVKPDAGYGGLSQVTVEGDAKLIASNIKSGVTIFGVTGTMNLPERTATITTRERVMLSTTVAARDFLGASTSITAYRIQPLGDMTMTGNGSETQVTTGSSRFVAYPTKSGWARAGKITAFQNISTIGDKLKYLCPAGKTFEATVSGVLCVMAKPVYDAGQEGYTTGYWPQSNNSNVTGSMVYRGNSNSYTCDVTPLSGITYNSGYTSINGGLGDYTDSDWYVTFIITGISYLLS